MKLLSKLLQRSAQSFNFTTVSYEASENLSVSGLGICSSSVTKDHFSLMLPNPFVEIKVVDDTGKVAPTGTAGDIHVRSPFTMVGYLDDPDQTEQVITASKWYITGDQGVIAEDGTSFEIIGRTKDVISKGGTKVHPKSIEDILLQHPGVSKVCVIGVPDPKLFNEICACIIATPSAKLTEDGLSSFCTKTLQAMPL